MTKWCAIIKNIGDAIVVINRQILLKCLFYETLCCKIGIYFLDGICLFILPGTYWCYCLFGRMLYNVFFIKRIGKGENNDSQENDYDYEAF